jgi:hypothetical protein
MELCDEVFAVPVVAGKELRATAGDKRSKPAGGKGSVAHAW